MRLQTTPPASPMSAKAGVWVQVGGSRGHGRANSRVRDRGAVSLEGWATASGNAGEHATPPNWTWPHHQPCTPHSCSQPRLNAACVPLDPARSRCPGLGLPHALPRPSPCRLRDTPAATIPTPTPHPELATQPTQPAHTPPPSSPSHTHGSRNLCRAQELTSTSPSSPSSSSPWSAGRQGGGAPGGGPAGPPPYRCRREARASARRAPRTISPFTIMGTPSWITEGRRVRGSACVGGGGGTRQSGRTFVFGRRETCL